MPVKQFHHYACQADFERASLTNSRFSLPFIAPIKHPCHITNPASLFNTLTSIPFKQPCQKLHSASLSTPWSRLPLRNFTSVNHPKPTSRSTSSISIPRIFIAASCHVYSASLSTTHSKLPVAQFIKHSCQALNQALSTPSLSLSKSSNPAKQLYISYVMH